MNDLQELLDRVRENTRSGSRRALRAALAALLGNRKEYYRQSVALALEEPLADAFYKALLLELDEEESDSIETAELAYTGLTSVMNDPEAITPAHYKRRLLLLHYFSDYFTDAIIEIFLKKYRDDNLLEARNMALECIEKMQLSDMLLLEEHHPDFINGDEQLADACNAISLPPELSEAERTEAALLHKVLHAYLKAKYKN